MEAFLKPIAEQIVDEIDLADAGEPAFPSRRLPPSKLGHECSAYPWHLFRWSAKVRKPGSVARLGKGGKDDEARVINSLRLAGWKINDRGDGGEQHTGRSHNGHVVSKIEGFAENPKWFAGETVLLEIKGLNRRRFNLIKSGKPLRLVEQQHWAQAIKYMHQFHLRYCLYIAICRDTGELWAHIIAADDDAAQVLNDLAWSIIRSKVPPGKISNVATNHVCKQCDMIGPCQLGEPPPRTCRSCFYCVPSETDFGQMHCEKWASTIPEDYIETTCNQYTRII